LPADFRKKMAWKAYQHTASYDAQVQPQNRSVLMAAAGLAAAVRVQQQQQQLRQQGPEQMMHHCS
jgi:AICAR transformylase/IMP cyclohydrolase PurH